MRLTRVSWNTLIILAGLLADTVCGGSVGRVRRYIGQFGNMIRLLTQREALLYNSYGNHCGFGGDQADPAVDGVDECCKQHDYCYGNTDTGVCYWHWLGAFFISYSWDFRGAIECYDKDPCRYAVCLCDKIAAECFSRNQYNQFHKRKSILDFLT